MSGAIAARKHAQRQKQKKERQERDRQLREAANLKKLGIGLSAYADRPDWPTITTTDSLYAHAFRGRDEDVLRVLKDRKGKPRVDTQGGGEDRDKIFFGRIPLHAASMAIYGESSVKCVRHLLDHGADPNETSRDGRTALHIAAYGGKVEILRMLLDRPEVLVNQKDNDQCTPLNYAARAKQVEACKFLVDRGADALQVDAEGNSPMRLAAFLADKPNKDVIKSLVDCAERNREGWRKQIRTEKKTSRSLRRQLADTSRVEISDYDPSMRGDGTMSSMSMMSSAPVHSPPSIAKEISLPEIAEPVKQEVHVPSADLCEDALTPASTVIDYSRAVLKLNEELTACLQSQSGGPEVLGKQLREVVESNSKLIQQLANHMKNPYVEGAGEGGDEGGGGEPE